MTTQRLQQLSEIFTFVLVPGLRDSDAHHWQSCWGRRFPDWRRISQRNWQDADIDAWVSAIRRELHCSQRPAILLGHSFGALASCRLVQTQRLNVAGILMVAPAEPSFFELEAAVLPESLPTPTLMVVSQNDPLMPLERARFWAGRWQARLLDIGEAGHINTEAGFGEWDYGLAQLAAFADGLLTQPKEALSTTPFY